MGNTHQNYCIVVLGIFFHKKKSWWTCKLYENKAGMRKQEDYTSKERWLKRTTRRTTRRLPYTCYTAYFIVTIIYTLLEVWIAVTMVINCCKKPNCLGWWDGISNKVNGLITKAYSTAFRKLWANARANAINTHGLCNTQRSKCFSIIWHIKIPLGWGREIPLSWGRDKWLQEWKRSKIMTEKRSFVLVTIVVVKWESGPM